MTDRNSHCLLQGKYLGCTKIDNRCSRRLLPWIIEEFLLSELDYKSIWFSPGANKLSVVEDDGTEFMSHGYGEITHFTVLKDEKSFGYLARSSEAKFNLYAYQALQKPDVSKVEQSIKGVVVNGNQALGSLSPPEGTELLTSSYSSSSFELTSSMDSLNSSGPAAVVKNNSSNALSANNNLMTFNLNYLGMISTGSKSLSPVELDMLINTMKQHNVERQREETPAVDNASGGKQSSPVTRSPKLRAKKKVKGDIGPTISVVQIDNTSRNRASSFNEQKKDSPLSKRKKKHSFDGTLSTGGPGQQQEDSKQNGQHLEITDSANHSSVPVDHNAVGRMKGGAEHSDELPKRDIILIITSTTISLQDANDNKTIRKKKVTEIASCTQGSAHREYIGFVCKEDSMQKLFCHMLKTDDKKLASQVVSAFRKAFSTALAVHFPTTLCEACPLGKLNSLCRSMEGASLEVAQSNIEGILSSLSESDCPVITAEYNAKKSDLTEHEQIVLMMSLLRKHFEMLQSSHNHSDNNKDNHGDNNKDNHGDNNKDSTDGSSGRRFLQLAKAKHTLASSFENLKSKGKKGGKHDKTKNKVAYGGSHSAGSSPALPRKQYNRSPSPEDSPLVNAVQNISLNKPLRIMTKPPLVESHTPVSKASDHIATIAGGKTDGQFNTLPRCTRPKTSVRDSNIFPQLSRINIRSLRLKSQSPTRSVSYQGDRHGDGDKMADSLVSSPPPSVKPFVRGHRKQPSWIQQIFVSVTPDYDVKSSIAASITGSPSFATRGNIAQGNSGVSLARIRWKIAIKHQIALLHMEKNKNKADDDKVRRMKLAYSDPCIDGRQSVLMWSDLLSKKIQKQDVTLAKLRQAVQKGVRPAMRPAAWQLMVSHYAYRQKKQVIGGTTVEEYKKLCTANTDYSHAISIDLGRTFPSYPYFSLATRVGQQSLERLLHAYAVKDPDVGYCQGLSFVAGMILIHTKSEEEGFDLLSNYMSTYQARPIYQADMFSLQIALYQFSRLLHDMNPEIYEHMEGHDITPFMYAAPWLLTLFASQFPIPFVARIMDLMFLEGIEAMFKTAIALLTLHQDYLLSCRGMEDTVEYIKIEIPAKAMENVQDIIDAVLTCDVNVNLKLQHYEVEYRVMHELLSAGPADESLRKQNQELIEHVAECKGAIVKMEAQMAMMQEQITLAAKVEEENKILIQELRTTRAKMEEELGTMREQLSLIPKMNAMLKTLQEQVMNVNS